MYIPVLIGVCVHKRKMASIHLLFNQTFSGFFFSSPSSLDRDYGGYLMPDYRLHLLARFLDNPGLCLSFSVHSHNLSTLDNGIRWQ